MFGHLPVYFTDHHIASKDEKGKMTKNVTSLPCVKINCHRQFKNWWVRHSIAKYGSHYLSWMSTNIITQWVNACLNYWGYDHETWVNKYSIWQKVVTRHCGEYSGMGGGGGFFHSSYETGKLSHTHTHTHTSTHFCMQSSLQGARHSLICHNFLPAWNHVMEMDAVINNKTSCEPNLIRFIHTVKHHPPLSANITWPKYITYTKEKLICKVFYLSNWCTLKC
jgi:hypothetical protein